MGSSIFSRNWPQLGAARVEQASFFGFCLNGVVRLARAQGVDYDAEQRKAPTPELYHGGRFHHTPRLQRVFSTIEQLSLRAANKKPHKSATIDCKQSRLESFV
ncbi:hypothetical protein, partial [Vibrio cholerae]